jgi:lipopolysaccharide transport system permease protein
MSLKDSEWEHVITSRSSSFVNQLKAVWEYRDLLIMFIRRDTFAFYKQTILGPLWFFLQPLATSLAFYLLFTHVADMDTKGIPGILFYMAGINLWSFFAEVVVKTSTIFKDNQNIFGKVYFPRLIVPLSTLASGLFKYMIQFSLFLIFYFLYLFNTDSIHPQDTLILLPFLVLLTGASGLGLGLIISAFTTKYRDLVYLLNFGIQLFMYATPVVYSVDHLKNGKWFILANPLSAIFEAYRHGLFGVGHLNYMTIIYSLICSFVMIVCGAYIFNRTEKSVMDII